MPGLKGGGKNIMYGILTAVFLYIVAQLNSSAVYADLANCEPLDLENSMYKYISVATAVELEDAVRGASPKTTVLVNPGHYKLNRQLNINVSDISIIGSTGNAEDVIIDGQYKVGAPIAIFGQTNVTIANLSIKRAHFHNIHLQGQSDNFRLHNAKLIDSREQLLKINPNAKGERASNGKISCSYFLLTDDGRKYIEDNPTPGHKCYTGGIDAHTTSGFMVTDSHFEDVYCTNGGLAEYAIHFWSQSQQTTILRNTIINCARGIGFGLGRKRGHLDGVIRNNYIYANIKWYDTGIGLESAAPVLVEHNTVYSQRGVFNSAIDSRFSGTRATLKNNLIYPFTTLRRGAKIEESATVKARASWFKSIKKHPGLLENHPEVDKFVKGKGVATKTNIDYFSNSRNKNTVDVGAATVTPR